MALIKLNRAGRRAALATTTAAAAAALLGLPPATSSAAPPGPYSIRTVGPSAGGTLEFLTDSGDAVGRREINGVSTWFDDGAGSIDIGMIDAEHTNPTTGEVNHRAIGVTPDGFVAGNSDRFVGLGSGKSAWSFRNGQTTEIGLLGPVHTRSDGWREDTARYLSATGDIFGTTRRFGSGGGQSVFVYNGVATTEIGLTGAQQTHSSGYRHNTPTGSNAAGHAIGYAERFSGSSERGQSAWIYRNGVTSEIGLLDAAHTRSDGTRWNWTTHLNAGGAAAGLAARYSGSTMLGYSAWVSNGISTTTIGLTGASYTGSDGSRYQSISRINDAGHVTGTTNRYAGGTFLGESAWIYNGTNTIEIAPTDAAHVSSTGARHSVPGHLNEVGQVAGVATRYAGTTETGRSAWFFDGTSTEVVGLTDAAHTAPGGVRQSEPTFLTDSGFLAGVSTKYAGDGTVVSSTPWVFDSTTDQTYTLQFEVSAGGFSKTEINHLGEDGTVLGSYRRYDGFNTLGDFAYYWTPGDGFFDLGLRVDGGLDAAGWSRLVDTTHTNSLSQIGGSGLRTPGQLHAAYVMTPVPEPRGLALLAAGALGLTRSRRRRGYSGAPLREAWSQQVVSSRGER